MNYFLFIFDKHSKQGEGFKIRAMSDAEYKAELASVSYLRTVGDPGPLAIINCDTYEQAKHEARMHFGVRFEWFF
jgi:hypothetical protein